MGRGIRLFCGLFLAVLALVACGFTLQRDAELPPEMQRVRLDIQDPYSHFARTLRILLEQGGASLVDDGEAAVLEVPHNTVRKEILTIGDNARVREYRLRHDVDFRLLDAEGRVVVPEQRLAQSRVISFDEQDILGAAQEDEFLRRDMAETLARLVVRRLSTAGG